MSMKVIGAGFGRTGTTSLKGALEMLEFNRCYHMFEVIKNPSDAAVWNAAVRGESVDWQAVFSGYRATLDWPGCTFYKTLIEAYPDAKVLLTTRDPEAWYASAQATIHNSNTMKPPPSMQPFVEMVNSLVWQHTFKGRFEDKAYAIEVFNAHNEEVKRTVPSDKLLVYEVTQGWEPLCQFLEVDAPQDTPFPHLNDRRSFQERVVKMIEQPKVEA